MLSTKDSHIPKIATWSNDSLLSTEDSKCFLAIGRLILLRYSLLSLKIANPQMVITISYYSTKDIYFQWLISTEDRRCSTIYWKQQEMPFEGSGSNSSPLVLPKSDEGQWFWFLHSEPFFFSSVLLQILQTALLQISSWCLQKSYLML